MFLGKLRWGHRHRLTALLTVAVSLALAAVFTTIFVLLREQALSRRYAELERSVSRVAIEWSGSSTLLEEHEDFPEFEFVVAEVGGHVLASTTMKPMPFPSGRFRVGNKLYFGTHRGQVMVVGTGSANETEAGIRQLGLVLLGLWLPLVLLTAAIAWYGGGLVLRPVTELVVSADKLSSVSASSLLETTDLAEFAALAKSLNTMIERVRQSASIQEQFASDAAHELRSPLALLRTRVETTLLNPRTGEEHEKALHSILHQIDRLASIVETLLSSARRTTGIAPPIQVDIILKEIVDRWVVDTGWDSRRLGLFLFPCRASITPEELTIVMGNLLDNATRHALETTSVLVRLESRGDGPCITVRNYGSQVSIETKERAFDRFYRSDEGRNRDGGGAGIGLAVVKKIIEGRNGQVGFEGDEDEAVVFVTLPFVANDL